jgi:hypothetical protein
MSILTDFNDKAASAGVNAQTKCFLCGERLEATPAIIWVGSTEPIAFHPTCAASFQLRLARDCWQYQRDLDDAKPRK